MPMLYRAQIGRGFLLAFLMAIPGFAQQGIHLDPPVQQPARPQAEGEETLESITEEFERELVALERQRMERLVRLAETQPKEEADRIYEALFQFAFSSGLFREAEPIATHVLETRALGPQVVYLAEITNVLAKAERGAFQESLESIVAALRAEIRQDDDPDTPSIHPLPLSARLALLEAYYQRLIQADQFDIARQAFQLLLENAQDEALKDFLSNRLAQLELVGQPAPPIEGTDVDGKPFRLADFEGDVVLVAFWASWCLPNAVQMGELQDVYNKYEDQGFQVVGINLDTLQEGVDDPSVVLPFVRRFLLDYNIRWPNLINGTDDQDYARAYNVTEIPATYLIGRDRTILHLDLTRANLERVVADALGL